MAEEKEKSLDQQIKEAELAKLKAETADVEKHSKQARVMGVPIVQIIFGGIVVGFVLLNYIQPLINLNTEKANLQTDISTKEKDYNEIKDRLERIELVASKKALEQLSDSLQIEQAKLAVLNDSLSRETTTLEQQKKEAQDELANIQRRIGSINALNAQKQKILAITDSLEIRVKIVTTFGNLDSTQYANVLQQYQMIKTNNYYDSRLNPEGKGIANQFQPQPGDSVIVDAAIGLTWQQSGSGYTSYASAENYIKEINDENYGGYNDWRLPTLEEAMSLMEPEQKKGLYIAGQFDIKQRYIWTSDKFTASTAWVVYFNSGYCNYYHVDVNTFVRAVR